MITPGPIGYVLGERAFRAAFRFESPDPIEWKPAWLKEVGDYWHAVDITKKGDYSGLFTIIPKAQGKVEKNIKK